MQNNFKVNDFIVKLTLRFNSKLQYDDINRSTKLFTFSINNSIIFLSTLTIEVLCEKIDVFVKLKT